jgi:hypothetical protein
MTKKHEWKSVSFIRHKRNFEILLNIIKSFFFFFLPHLTENHLSIKIHITKGGTYLLANFVILLIEKKLEWAPKALPYRISKGRQRPLVPNTVKNWGLTIIH